MSRDIFIDHDETCPLGKGDVVITVEKSHPPGAVGYKIIQATCDLNEIEWSNCHSKCPLIEKYSYENVK